MGNDYFSITFKERVSKNQHPSLDEIFEWKIKMNGNVTRNTQHLLEILQNITNVIH